MKTCFFIGHREASESLLPSLLQAVERHIAEYGVTDFVVGQYGNFDHLAAIAVKEAKKFYPTVTLALLLPYHPYDRPLPIPEGFDSTYYPPGMELVPKRAAIARANRYLADHSTHLIFGVWHSVSNAYDLLQYVRRKNGTERPHITILTPPKKETLFPAKP